MAAIFSRLKKTTVFYLVRHGESEGNREQRIQGKTDLPLTDLGREHASHAGCWLSRHPVDAIFSSPLKRAAETARIIRDHLGEGQLQNALVEGPGKTGSSQNESPVQPGTAPLAIRYLEELEELETGIFSGKTFKELKEGDPDLWERFMLESWEVVPGAETIAQLQERALKAWEMLVEAANKGPSHILAVSHGGFIQWMIKVTWGMRQESWHPLLRITNCSISELRIELVGQAAPGQESPSGQPGQSKESAKTRRGYLPEWRHISHQPWT